jgi:hypothetical protein
MDNPKIVFSDEHTHDHQALPHMAILVFQGAGLALVLFLIAGLWHLLGFEPAFIAILACCVLGAGGFLFTRWEHHQHDKADRTHIRDLASRAIENGHSIEFRPVTRELRTISPYTIPNGALTIKDNQFGNGATDVQALPVAQPLLEEFYDAIRPDSLQTGLGRISSNGELAIAGILESVHFKLIGGSGFGKSCLAGAMLDVATTTNSPDVLRIALLDLEYRTSRLFEHLDHVYEVRDKGRTVRLIGRDADEVAARIGTLKAELNRRATAGASTPVLLIYVEEMLSLQYEVDPDLQKQMLADLNILALRGKKYGMFFLAVMQTDYSTKELREAKGMFRTRGGFAIDPPAARASGFVNNVLIKENYQIGKPGQYVLERPAFSGMVLAPRYNLDHLLTTKPTTKPTTKNAFFDTLVVDSDVPTTAPVEPLVVGTPHLSVRELKVLELMRQERGQNEIIKEIWKVGSRDGRPYNAAVAEYRKIVATIVAESE